MNKLPLLAAAALLALASFGSWPYGFYQMLRLIVCGAAIYVATKAHELKRPNWSSVMAAIALLFNPLIPIRFAREEWQPIDFGTAVIFAVAARVIKDSPTTEPCPPAKV